MKKDLTELVFILDRSGSMEGLERDTIGGFHGMIEKQKRLDGAANVTTVLFDDRFDIIHDRLPIQAIQPLTEEDYYARGTTALLDAIGKTLRKTIHTQRHLPDDEKAEKVIFIITTDGMENASREYSYNAIRQTIEQQKESSGWEFLFLGANMDAIAEARKFGIEADRSATFCNDSKGIAANFRAINDVSSQMRQRPMARIDGSWKHEIEKDFQSRTSKKPHLFTRNAR